MIYALPDATFLAILEGAPAGLVGSLGVRVGEPDGTVVVARSVDVTEVQDAPGTYSAVLVAPSVVGDYLVVWDAPGAGAVEQLTVSGQTPGPPVAGLPVWAPTVEEVAEVTPAYTRGDFEDDRVPALPSGAEQGTYTDQTDPTRTVVEGLIASACGTVEGRAGTTVPVAYYGLARSAAKWFTAAMISAGKRPAGTDDASGEYRAHIGNFAADMARLIELVKTGPTRLA